MSHVWGGVIVQQVRCAEADGFYKLLNSKGLQRREICRPIFVSILSPSVVFQTRANQLASRNCRYNGGHEKAMGIQKKGHQRMVDGLVRRWQKEGQGVSEQKTGRALPPHQIHTTQFGRVHECCRLRLEPDGRVLI